MAINAIREGIQNRDGGKEAREERAFRDNVKKRFANLDWVKKQSLVTGSISPDGIVKPLHLAKASDYPQSVSTGIQSVRSWRESYTSRAIAYLKFLVARQSHYEDHGDAESLVAFADTIRAHQDPRDAAPMKLQGFLSGIIQGTHQHGRSMMIMRDSTFSGELPALDATGIVHAANLSMALMEEAAELLGSVDDIAEETHQLNTEVALGDGDEWRAGSAASKAQFFLMERYSERRGRSVYVWPVADLSRILEQAARSLGVWIDRSIKK